jgi:hypothetical protein
MGQANLNLQKKPAITNGRPPYVPYKTLINFINGLQSKMPTRVDRSTMPSLSGGAQGRLLGALRYLNLIDCEGRPEEALSAIVNSEGRDRQRAFSEVVRQAYGFLFVSNFDLTRASKQEFQDVFARQGLGGENLKKALSLFLRLARMSGLQVSDHILSRAGRTPITRRRTLKEKGSSLDLSNQISDRCRDLLLEFPSLDPNWSEPAKSNWLEGLRELLRHIK